MLKMRPRTIIALTALLMSVQFATCLHAQSSPRWATKGVKSINAQRSNDTYEVSSFNTYNAQLEVLERNGPEVLKGYVSDKYGTNPNDITINLIHNSYQPEYEVVYMGIDSVEQRIIAKRIDTYTCFDDYELNVYQFEHHQLYAISRPNVQPVFDRFEYTNSNQGLSAAMSLVPGLSQYYKGQHSKANVIVGAEVFFAAATVVMDYKRRDCHKMVSEDSFFADSWRSKERGWRNMEICALAGFVGVYIYNVIDGITSKGPRQIKVKRASKPQYSLAPYATPKDAGLSLTVNF